VFALPVRVTRVQFHEGRALADDSDDRRNASETYANPDSSGAEVAVAVVVEQSDAARSEVGGNGPAAPVAKAAMEAALRD
jgi:hypothetical protein